MRAWPFVLLALLAQPVVAQSFTCRFGTQAACLEYNDTVCTGGARCVGASAICFDQFQCNYRGFVCRSDLDHCVEDYQALLERHNQLVDDFNVLLEDARQLRTQLIDTESCVLLAVSLTEARLCF